MSTFFKSNSFHYGNHFGSPPLQLLDLLCLLSHFTLTLIYFCPPTLNIHPNCLFSFTFTLTLHSNLQLWLFTFIINFLLFRFLHWLSPLLQFDSLCFSSKFYFDLLIWFSTLNLRYHTHLEGGANFQAHCCKIIFKITLMACYKFYFIHLY